MHVAEAAAARKPMAWPECVRTCVLTVLREEGEGAAGEGRAAGRMAEAVGVRAAAERPAAVP